MAIVGGGISGLVHAHVFREAGLEPVVFEKGPAVGGVWAVAYPEVTLQNVDFQYRLSDRPWSAPPAFHPTGEQIRRYWGEVADELGLDVRLGHEVISAEERDGGWALTVRNGEATEERRFDKLVVAVGQYTEGKVRPTWPGEAEFRGVVGTERDVRALDRFADRRVVVIGFGKSALDMATLAAERGATVHHVFRTPRWTLPMRLLGIHSSWFVFSRLGSVMMTCWDHPTAPERFLHRRLAPLVRGFWGFLGSVVRRQIQWDAGRTDAAGRERLRAVLPPHPVLQDLRSALALAPPTYFRRVAEGGIEPHRGELASFEPDGVVLADGTRIACDQVVLAMGSERPRFPFLSARHREVLEAEPDGVQLYRHMVHPRFQNLGFAGFNHGFLHVPASEIGAWWLASLFRGRLALPPAEEMERTIERIRAWKRANIVFEPSRSCAVNTRVQQYLDIVLQDLGVSPYRKLPNVLAEVFARYGAEDYAGVGAELRPGRPVALDS